MKRWPIIAVLFLVAGCRGELLATAKLSGPGTAEARFDTDKNVVLWSDFDGKWEGSAVTKSSAPPISYDIDLVQDGNVVGHVVCKTGGASSRTCGWFTRTGSNFAGDCEFRMNCELPPHRGGEVVLKVKGEVVDPSRVQDLRNMSLNVRAQ